MNNRSSSLYTKWGPNSDIPLFTKWSLLQIALALGALGVIIGKLAFGLGAVTNLSDEWPWGLWVAFDVGGYISIAGAGFTTAAIVYIFRLKKYWPVIRTAVLIGLLGYTIAGLGIAIDIGRTPRILHPIWMWQPHSVMFEVAWCVMLYTTVLYLEFSPLLVERLRIRRLLQLLHYLMIPLVIAGITLSFLHQSSLGALLLLTPDMHPLWYGPLMSYLFLISAIAVGLAMVIFVSIITSKVWKLPLRMNVLGGLGKIVAWVLAVYLSIRFIQLFTTGNISALAFDEFGLLFFLEVGVCMALPMVLLFLSKVRKSTAGLVTATSLIVVGVILNRVNTFVISHAPVRETFYFPSLTEILFTVGLVAGAMFAFRLAAKYLPLFERRSHGLTEVEEKASSQANTKKTA